MGKFGKIYIELNDNLVDITDLDKDSYEEFLDLMTSLKLSYIAITGRQPSIEAEKVHISDDESIKIEEFISENFWNLL